jgi:hypothetical protein
MTPPAALRLSRGAHHRSRVLLSDSRVLIAAAEALIAQSRQSIARQSYVRVVCAWCQQPMRWQCAEATVRGQLSHSICFPCFADVFQELNPETALPSVATKARRAPLGPYLRLGP